jgi:DNA-binding NtrC family response regulator
MSHSWPGNIRELENAMERAFIMESTDVLEESSFDLQASSQGMMIPPPPPAPYRSPEMPTTTPVVSFEEQIHAIPRSARPQAVSSLIPDGADLNFPLLKERFEKEFIIKALTAYRGRINQTAEATQMTKVTLLRKLEKYGIDAKDYFKI